MFDELEELLRDGQADPPDVLPDAHHGRRSSTSRRSSSSRCMLFVLGLIGSGTRPARARADRRGRGGRVSGLGDDASPRWSSAWCCSWPTNEPLRAKVEASSLTVPGLAGCFRAFALNRFCAGVLHDRRGRDCGPTGACGLSLRATANRGLRPGGGTRREGGPRGAGRGVDPGGYGPRLFPDEFLSAVQRRRGHRAGSRR